MRVALEISHPQTIPYLILEMIFRHRDLPGGVNITMIVIMNVIDLDPQGVIVIPIVTPDLVLQAVGERNDEIGLHADTAGEPAVLQVVELKGMNDGIGLHVVEIVEMNVALVKNHIGHRVEIVIDRFETRKGVDGVDLGDNFPKQALRVK